MDTPNTELRNGNALSDAVQILSRDDLVREFMARGYDAEMASEFAGAALGPGETLPIIRTTSDEHAGKLDSEITQRIVLSTIDLQPRPMTLSEYAQNVANLTGKTAVSLEHVQGTFVGKVTSTAEAVGEIRLATVENADSVLILRCTLGLRINHGHTVQIKTDERGTSVCRIPQSLER